jgi:hypothetical protein
MLLLFLDTEQVSIELVSLSIKSNYQTAAYLVVEDPCPTHLAINLLNNSLLRLALFMKYCAYLK